MDKVMRPPTQYQTEQFYHLKNSFCDSFMVNISHLFQTLATTDLCPYYFAFSEWQINDM